MTYLEELGTVVSAHVDDLQADLTAARAAYERSMADAREFERTIQTLEGLLLMNRDSEFHSPELAPGGTTLHEAMVIALQAAPQRRLRAPELAAEVERRRLYRMRDGRPVEPQQIHARAGNYPQLFDKEDTYIKLK